MTEDSRRNLNSGARGAISFHDFMELFKLRIVFMGLLMGGLGFFCAVEPPIPWLRFWMMLCGLALVGASSGALNQYLETDIDKKMHRTSNRPLPTGRVSTGFALWVGLIAGTLGIVVLYFLVNTLTAILGILTLIFYLLIYTPSKRYTSLSTLIGAIPGAFPPLMGWTAVTGFLGKEGLLLFAVLFVWQIPHFLAIAWMYKEDYARANLPVLPVIDLRGNKTSYQIVLYCLALLPLTLIPSLQGLAGPTYTIGTFLIGFLFLVCGIYLAVKKTREAARILFFASILYLPAYCLLLAWDKV